MKNQEIKCEGWDGSTTAAYICKRCTKVHSDNTNICTECIKEDVEKHTEDMVELSPPPNL